jgi:hypothetical protein
MATIYGKGPPRSPTRGHTISQLRGLRASNYHNPDTGTELHAEEADAHLAGMEQAHADRGSLHKINQLMKIKTRSRNRPMLTGDLVFRYIHGHTVAFQKTSEPFL